MSQISIEINRLLTDVTEGPWGVHTLVTGNLVVAPEAGGDRDAVFVVPLPSASPETSFGRDRVVQEANARLGAEARTLLPRAGKEIDRLAAQLVAISGAAAELSRWPDFVESPFLAIINGERVAVQPERLEGVFEAWEKHVDTLAPFGKGVIEENHRQALDLIGARKRIASLEAELKNGKMIPTEVPASHAAACVSFGLPAGATDRQAADAIMRVRGLADRLLASLVSVSAHFNDAEDGKHVRIPVPEWAAMQDAADVLRWSLAGMAPSTVTVREQSRWILSVLAGMSEHDRVDYITRLTAAYCPGCGRPAPCQCLNDE